MTSYPHKYKYVGVRPQTPPFYPNFASQRANFRVQWGYIAREGWFFEGKFRVQLVGGACFWGF